MDSYLILAVVVIGGRVLLCVGGCNFRGDSMALPKVHVWVVWVGKRSKNHSVVVGVLFIVIGVLL